MHIGALGTLARAWPALALAVLAGCGGSSAPATDAGSEIVPASAAAYVSVQSDLDSAQWKQVDELLGRFPDGDRAVERLHGDLGHGVNYERDLEPALGPTAELVWLDFDGDGKNAVALTQPDDESKLRELVRKGGDSAVVGEVEGWSVVARNEALIDRYRQALEDGSIADDGAFQRTTEELPDDALATVYVDGERATSALESALRDRGGAGALESAGRVERGAAALEAADDGFRLTGLVRAQGTAPELADIGTLLKEVPAGAFLAVNFHGTRETAERLRSPQQLGPLGQVLGPSLSALGSLLQGEGVVYARPGALFPEVTALLAPPDADAAKQQLDLLTSTIPGLADAKRQEIDIAGVKATAVDLGRFSLVYAAWEGRLAITTLPDGIRALREEGDRLVDEDRYRDALDAAGVTDEEHVLAYADLQRTLPLFEQLITSTAPVPVVPTESRNLRPLRSLVASTRTEGDATTVRVFLEIRG